MKLADKYMEENPSVKIELIEVPYADLENKIKNMINGKGSPGIGQAYEYRAVPESACGFGRVCIG